MPDGSSQSLSPHVRSAVASDADSIFSLIESMTDDGTLLRRPLSEIRQHMDSFVVAESAEGAFLGCAALHRYGKHLAEIRSIAVRPEARGVGAGGLLLERLLLDIEQNGTGCACLFTRIPGFFARYGFHSVSAGSVPDKVAKDCIRCPRRTHCDEIAMTHGELPEYAPDVLAAARQLVHL